MAATRCTVSFIDSEAIVHIARVQAESLYEAVAIAVAEFRDDKLAPSPSPMTEFTIAIERPAIEHRIRLCQVLTWVESTTREGPAGVTKRQRVKSLLGES